MDLTLDQISEFTKLHREAVVGVTALFAVIAYYFAFGRRKKSHRRERAMTPEEHRQLDALTRRERNVYTDTVMADIITEGAEEAVYRGTLTRIEVDQYYRSFARSAGLSDLIPRAAARNQRQSLLKKEVKKRLGNGFYKRLVAMRNRALVKKAEPKKEPTNSKEKLQALMLRRNGQPKTA